MRKKMLISVLGGLALIALVFVPWSTFGNKPPTSAAVSASLMPDPSAQLDKPDEIRVFLPPRQYRVAKDSVFYNNLVVLASRRFYQVSYLETAVKDVASVMEGGVTVEFYYANAGVKKDCSNLIFPLYGEHNNWVLNTDKEEAVAGVRAIGSCGPMVDYVMELKNSGLLEKVK